ncbi:helix-turn-helix transcriptional regulator [Pantoea stewartii]|uniref:helix-turn-helix transcriptional regulator n=1 Tax=Pantoea stewartii TaxID=66269 RepID=UPI0025A18D52|nr:PAS domain-containing protein [Pantoea stewartii]
MLSQRSVRGGKAGMKDSCPTVLSRKALNFFERSDEPWGAKDRDSRFIYANQAYFDFLEIHEDIARRITEFSYADIPVFAQMAERLIAHDRQVMQSEKRMEAIGTLMIGAQYRSFIFERFPLYDEESEVTGTVFHMKPFERISMNYFLEKPFYGEATFSPPTSIFSKREWDVLFLLFRGAQITQISEFLEITYSSVRNIISRLLLKTGTSSREKLLDNGLKNGWHLYVPSRFISIGYDILFKEHI